MHWLQLLTFFTVSFQMGSQSTRISACIVTVSAFVWPFTRMCYQMRPQVACLGRCIVTLVAFVWLFSTVRFQMSPQIACFRECIITLVANVLLDMIGHLFHWDLQQIGKICYTRIIISNWGQLDICWMNFRHLKYESEVKGLDLDLFIPSPNGKIAQNGINPTNASGSSHGEQHVAEWPN